MKSIRRIHAWLGILFAPSILLFALSGMFQMLGCHEGEGGSEPAGWIVRLAQIHMKQTVELPRKRAPRPQPAPPASATAGTETAGPTAGPPAPGARPAGEPREAREAPSTLPLKIFFLAMSLGLIASSILGLYIAFTSKRDRRLHVGLLLAGVVLPAVLLLL